jgi:hypothetical protein
MRAGNGDPATTASGGVRTCTAAIDAGLTSGDTLFVLGGEPFTPARPPDRPYRQPRRQPVRDGRGGRYRRRCQAATMPGDVHLLSDKIATIRATSVSADRPHASGAVPRRSCASPKVMLNVESGDYGVLEERTALQVLPPPFRATCTRSAATRS